MHVLFVANLLFVKTINKFHNRFMSGVILYFACNKTNGFTVCKYIYDTIYTTHSEWLHPSSHDAA